MKFLAGLGLNFVAKTVAIWLIFGPWKRPGVASGSGTEWIDIKFRLPYLEGTNLSLAILIIAIIIAVFTAVMLKGTHFGLRLKAIGKNDKAAYILGIPTTRYFLLAFGLCGLFAGIAGAILVTSKQYSLIPDAGFGYGFLGLLVAMLVNYHPILVTHRGNFLCCPQHWKYGTAVYGIELILCRCFTGFYGAVCCAGGWRQKTAG